MSVTLTELDPQSALKGCIGDVDQIESDWKQLHLKYHGRHVSLEDAYSHSVSQAFVRDLSLLQQKIQRVSQSISNSGMLGAPACSDFDPLRNRLQVIDEKTESFYHSIKSRLEEEEKIGADLLSFQSGIEYCFGLVGQIKKIKGAVSRLDLEHEFEKLQVFYKLLSCKQSSMNQEAVFLWKNSHTKYLALQAQCEQVAVKGPVEALNNSFDQVCAVYAEKQKKSLVLTRPALEAAPSDICIMAHAELEERCREIAREIEAFPEVLRNRIYTYVSTFLSPSLDRKDAWGKENITCDLGITKKALMCAGRDFPRIIPEKLNALLQEIEAMDIEMQLRGLADTILIQIEALPDELQDRLMEHIQKRYPDICIQTNKGLVVQDLSVTIDAFRRVLSEAAPLESPKLPPISDPHISQVFDIFNFHMPLYKAACEALNRRWEHPGTGSVFLESKEMELRRGQISIRLEGLDEDSKKALYQILGNEKLVEDLQNLKQALENVLLACDDGFSDHTQLMELLLIVEDSIYVERIAIAQEEVHQALTALPKQLLAAVQHQVSLLSRSERKRSKEQDLIRDLFVTEAAFHQALSEYLVEDFEKHVDEAVALEKSQKDRDVVLADLSQCKETMGQVLKHDLASAKVMMVHILTAFTSNLRMRGKEGEIVLKNVFGYIWEHSLNNERYFAKNPRWGEDHALDDLALFQKAVDYAISCMN